MASRSADLAALWLRLGLGFMMMLHGAPKLLGGPERWERLGGAMSNLGIDSFHTAFGLAAGLAEFVGGLLLMFGVLFRPALAAIIFTMFVATLRHVVAGDGFPRISHPLELGIAFVGLWILGPGRWSLRLRTGGRSHWWS